MISHNCDELVDGYGCLITKQNRTEANLRFGTSTKIVAPLYLLNNNFRFSCFAIKCVGAIDWNTYWSKRFLVVVLFHNKDRLNLITLNILY